MLSQDPGDLPEGPQGMSPAEMLMHIQFINYN